MDSIDNTTFEGSMHGLTSMSQGINRRFARRTRVLIAALFVAPIAVALVIAVAAVLS